MSQFNTPPNLNDVLKDMSARIRALAISQATPVCTLATRPSAANATQGLIVFVSDAAAGAQFQGWNGTGWVGLG